MAGEKSRYNGSNIYFSEECTQIIRLCYLKALNLNVY